MRHPFPQSAYTLVERQRCGAPLRETFVAPTQDEAIARAESVLDGGDAELWKGSHLVRRWTQIRLAEPRAITSG
ncbi:MULTISPECIES: hypothetical protein [unclassified Phenylobacterium]|uniref:hypothetical protein n=1 Tax=unclassified Phenylobacterium TaxID=2640670 RepID=UPI00083B7225|nr:MULTISPECIES: hypothetical protein [unclassified Phenylobacterium]